MLSNYKQTTEVTPPAPGGSQQFFPVSQKEGRKVVHALCPGKFPLGSKRCLFSWPVKEIGRRAAFTEYSVYIIHAVLSKTQYNSQLPLEGLPWLLPKSESDESFCVPVCMGHREARGSG